MALHQHLAVRRDWHPELADLLMDDESTFLALRLAVQRADSRPGLWSRLWRAIRREVLAW